ncbi:MAG: phosphate-starvation-inducible PsiE family protein [Agriterribacter sp.]
MEKNLQIFETVIMYTLMLIGMLFVVYETIFLIHEFGAMLIASFTSRQFVDGQGRVLGAVFFNVLLTMEIVETVRVFKKSHKSKIQIILLIGLIAVTRKILLLDAMHAEPVAELALSAMLVALGTGYYLVSRSLKANGQKEAEEA